MFIFIFKSISFKTKITIFRYKINFLPTLFRLRSDNLIVVRVVKICLGFSCIQKSLIHFLTFNKLEKIDCLHFSITHMY